MSEAGTSTRYEPRVIEARRQEAWRARDAFRTPTTDGERPHLYIKPSAPFTSGNIHIGHVRSYSIGDAYARFRRARGDDVLFAFGFDAFGLPAEKAGLAPGMKLIAVNGRRFNGDVLKDALKEAKGSSANIELLIANGDFFKTYAINYHEGEKYPHLVRDESKPDILSEIIKPLAGAGR